MDAKSERRARREVNAHLSDMGARYHDGIPVQEIDGILCQHGFNATEPAIYCGREGRAHEQVGEKTWLSLTWFKMPSGRYEIVAYVS